MSSKKEILSFGNLTRKKKQPKNSLKINSYQPNSINKGIIKTPLSQIKHRMSLACTGAISPQNNCKDAPISAEMLTKRKTNHRNSNSSSNFGKKLGLMKSIRHLCDEYISVLEEEKETSSRLMQKVDDLTKDNRKLHRQMKSLQEAYNSLLSGSRNSLSTHELPVPRLAIGDVQTIAFHEEFMLNAKDFSDSWQKLLKKHD